MAPVWLAINPTYLKRIQQMSPKPLSILPMPPIPYFFCFGVWNEGGRSGSPQLWQEVGVPPWKRRWRKHFGPRAERKNYGYRNHLAGYIRSFISEKK